MKKALTVLLALALVGSAAFAQEGPQISFGSWGRMLWDVVGTDGDNLGTGIHQSWGGASPRTSLSASAETDNVTYALDLFADGDEGISIGDNAYIEIRPFDGTNIPVKVAFLVGKSDKNEARDDAKFGLYNWERIGSVNTYFADQQGMIFSDLLDVDGGASIRIYPISGLTVGVAVPLGYDEEDYQSIFTAWGNSNIYAAYELPANIGKIRLGWDGEYDSADPYGVIWGTVGVAFDFDMVENLHIGVGAKIPTRGEEENGAAYQANLYARYKLDIVTPLTIHALFNSRIMTADESKGNFSGFGFQAGLAVDWEVLDNVPIFVDVRYANGVYMNGTSEGGFGENDCWTFGVGISKLWSNAEIGIAFALATNGYGGVLYGDEESYAGSRTIPGAHWTYGSDSQKLAWAIPIKFEYSF